MKKKSFLDIYFRNTKGVLKSFPSLTELEAAWPIVAIGFIALLPLTLTFGAGIKTLIDFFTRKDIPETTLTAVDKEIDALALDTKSISPVLATINTYSDHAKSASSNNLHTTLYRLEKKTKADLNTDIKIKRRALQEEQLEARLGIDKETLLSMCKESYIANLKLDESHQKRLDDYANQQRKQRITQRNSDMKTVIRAYVSASHNYGKGMQHAICNHFFPPAPTTDVDSSKNEKLTFTLPSNT